MDQEEGFIKKVFTNYVYYVLIGIISLLALVFLPTLGTEVGLEWKIPNTPIGWIVWVTTKLIVAMLNVLLFHSFICQAKVNIKDDARFLEARKVLREIKPKNYNPKSPKEFFGGEYGRKGVTIFISTGLATIALTQAILSFDTATFLSYLFTIIMGVVFGVLEMYKVQEYWTNEFYDYAMLKKKELSDELEEELNKDVKALTSAQSEKPTEEKTEC